MPVGFEAGRCFDRFGNMVRLARLPAVNMRKGRDPDVFVQLNIDCTWIEFKPGEVVYIKEADVRQDIYGVPQYLGSIQSILLSEDATLFRRKYYVNGAHMGYILVTADADLDVDIAAEIEKQVRDSKGPGNFRSLYLNIPRTNGNKDPVKVIPVGNIGSKDEFQAIKEIAEMDMLAMHRVYPGQYRRLRRPAKEQGNLLRHGSAPDAAGVFRVERADQGQSGGV